jgi:ribose 5-phosphate isomerase A
MNKKQAAAEAAAQRVANGMQLGLGTGSTVTFLLEALAERIRAGNLRDIVGVPTSLATEEHARSLGIALTTLEECPRLDMTIDGADEVSPDLNLIKGLGGALLREKIVAAASDQLLIIADGSKRVERLGSRSPLPVEVVSFGWSTNIPVFERLGATPTLRMAPDNTPYITDNGNYIVDCTFPNGIEDPHTLARNLDAQAGVVGHGLFLGMAGAAIIGTDNGVVVIESPSA